MATHLYEHGGVTLHVHYSVGEDNIPTIESVRVLDGSYRPCGPDLVEFLQPMALMYTATHGEAMLSVIVGDLYSAIERH